MLTTSTRVFIDFFFYFPPCLDLSRVIRSSLLFLSAITWQYNVPIYKNKCIFVSYSTKGVFFFFTSGYTQDTGQQCRTMDSRYEFLCVSILTINMNWYCCCCCVVARRFASISIGMRHLSWNTHRFLRTNAFEKKLSSRSFVFWIRSILLFVSRALVSPIDRLFVYPYLLLRLAFSANWMYFLFELSGRAHHILPALRATFVTRSPGDLKYISR